MAGSAYGSWMSVGELRVVGQAKAKRRKGRLAPKLVLAGVATVLALGVAEGVVRSSGQDWELVERQLYYQAADVWCHEAVDDPRVLYRLRKSVRRTFHSPEGENYTVSTGPRGYRGPVHPEGPKGDAVRIVVLGGSNVYGALVDDEETWPAQLEAKLNGAIGCQRFQVYNLGVSAYTGVQMAVIGGEAIDTLDPDLVIVAPSNPGPRPFLQGVEVRPYFERNPELWDYLLVADRPDGEQRRAVRPVLRFLASRSAFARLIAMKLRLRGLEGKAGLWRRAAWGFEVDNVEAIRTLVTSRAGDTTFALFLFPTARELTPRTQHHAAHPETREFLMLAPGFGLPLRMLTPYHEGLDVPTFHLDAGDRGQEYREAHPPAYVLEWYGEEIRDWLIAEGLVPADCPDEVEATDAMGGPAP